MPYTDIYVKKCLYAIKEEVDKYKNKLTNKINLENHIRNFINNYYDTLFYITECELELRYHNSDYPVKNRIVRVMDRMNSLLSEIQNNPEYDKENAYEDYLDYIENFSTAIEGVSELYDRYIRTDKDEKYDQKLKCVNQVLSNTNCPERIKILDLSCMSKTVGYFKSFEKCCETIKNAEKYVWRSSLEAYDDIKDYADRYIAGMFSGCRISNGVFDAVLCVPYYTYTSYSSNIKDIQKEEKQYLVNALKYVKPDGILMLIIKRYRMTKDMSSIIAKYLSNVSIIECTDNNDILIVGNRKKDKEADQELYYRLRKLYKKDFEYDNVADISLSISKTNLSVDAFKGCMYHQSMLRDVLSSGNLLEQFKQKLENTDSVEESKKPLLPFNVGQLGLVLTSGCLNGIIEEPEDNLHRKHYHVIKGSVIKKKDFVSSAEERGIVTTEEVTSNKVNINIIKPNGDILTLA